MAADTSYVVRELRAKRPGRAWKDAPSRMAPRIGRGTPDAVNPPGVRLVLFQDHDR